MGKVDIWMPLYVNDYLGDTMHLSTLEHGIYFLLMLHYWKKGQLTGDMSRLLAISKLTADDTSILLGVLEEFFHYESIEDKWYHSRIDHEIGNAESRRESSRLNGLKGGRPKNPEKTHSLSGGKPRSNPEITQPLTQTEPATKPNSNLRKSSSPSPAPAPPKTQSEEKDLCASAGAKGAYTTDFEDWWTAYPKKRSKDKAFTTWKKQRKRMPPVSELIEITERWVNTEDWLKEDGEFIPYPATWLNAAGWLDEVSEPGESPDQKRRRLLSAI